MAGRAGCNPWSLLTLGLVCAAATQCQRGPRIDHQADAGRIVPADTALFEIFPATATVERLAAGFEFLEGPAWVPGRDGFLVFSDVRDRRIYRWEPGGGIAASPAPFFRSRPPRGFGPNGLEVDARGALIICDQRGRRVLRVDRGGRWTVLADRFQGKRLNSPNDLVLASDGSLYFTDPPYGLRGQDKSPEKELDFNGVFRLRPGGRLERLAIDLPRPNGIALSPDERILYVANSEASRPTIVTYGLTEEDRGTRVFTVLDSAEAGGGVDGLTVDHRGNVYGATHEGVWIFAADGRRLGSIELPDLPRNITWGGAGSAGEPPGRPRALYITAGTRLYRVRAFDRSPVPPP